MIVKGTAGMEEEAQRFVHSLAPRDGATLVALSGELGAGKTAFVKAAARALGVTEHVTSPTFVIMKIYHLHKQKFLRLVHIDAYRLKGEHHLKVLGWQELLANPHNVIFVEWPEHAGTCIPANAERLTFRYSGDDEREILYEKDREAIGVA